jgi:ABC-type dipeptide/oligopeptide/nickel transport system permease component
MMRAVFVVRRILLATGVLIVFGSVVFVFFAEKTAPLAGQPLLPAYGRWLEGLFTGTSYRSLTSPVSVWSEVLPALGRTAALLGMTLVIVVVFGVLLGLASVRLRGTVVDLALRVLMYLAWGLPAFLLALLVQDAASGIGGGNGIGPFPIAGWPGSCPAGIGINAGQITPCPAAGHGATYVLNVLRYVTLPAATLALGFVGLHARFLRSRLLETLSLPFIVTARAKGLTEGKVILRHALRASAATFVSVLLADFGAIFGAAMAVDWIFQLHGLGTLLLQLFPQTDAAVPVDTYLLEGLLMTTAALLLLSSVLSEVAARWFDPRTRGRA